MNRLMMFLAGWSACMTQDAARNGYPGWVAFFAIMAVLCCVSSFAPAPSRQKEDA